MTNVNEIKRYCDYGKETEDRNLNKIKKEKCERTYRCTWE